MNKIIITIILSSLMILGGCCDTDKINEDKDEDNVNEQHYNIELDFMTRKDCYIITVKHDQNEGIYSVYAGVDVVEENITSVVLSKEDCNKLEKLIANVEIWEDSDAKDYDVLKTDIEYVGHLTVRRGDEKHSIEFIFPYKNDSNIHEIIEKLIELSPIEIK